MRFSNLKNLHQITRIDEDHQAILLALNSSPTTRREQRGACQFCLFRWSDEETVSQYSVLKGCKTPRPTKFAGFTNSTCKQFKWWYQ